MRKVLVTGGAGFVGRHVVKKWLESGAEVHCVDSIVPLTGGIAAEDGWPLFEPRDYQGFKFFREDCRTYFKREKIDDFDYAFHLAAIVGGRLMIENNPLAVADDLSIDSEFWQWTLRAKPKKVICFSSSAAYPIKYQAREGYQLLREDMIQFTGDIGLADMSYGWAKLTHEYLAHLAFERHGIKPWTPKFGPVVKLVFSRSARCEREQIDEAKTQTIQRRFQGQSRLGSGNGSQNGGAVGAGV